MEYGRRTRSLYTLTAAARRGTALNSNPKVSPHQPEEMNAISQSTAPLGTRLCRVMPTGGGKRDFQRESSRRHKPNAARMSVIDATEPWLGKASPWPRKDTRSVLTGTFERRQAASIPPRCGGKSGGSVRKRQKGMPEDLGFSADAQSEY